MNTVGRLFAPAANAPVIVKQLLAQQFLEGFVPIMALYAIMFERVGGLSFSQIGVLFSIWSLAYLIIELPSGVLADYWSRRNVIVLGGLLRTLGFTIWLVWPSFTGYAVGFALWGAMIACTSGSVTAYLHNELRTSNLLSRYARYYGWISSAHWLGTLVGYAVAAAITLRHTHILISLSLASSALMSVLLLFANESPYKRQDTYVRTLRAGLHEITHSPYLRYVSYGLFSVYMVVGVLEELLPRWYAQAGLSESGVSVVLALGLLATVTILVKLETFVQFSLTKQLLAMCVGVLCLLVGLYVSSLASIVLLFWFNMVFQLFRPVFQHHVQQAAKGDERATIGSIPGLAAGLFGAGAYAAIGAVAAVSSEYGSIALYGAIWLVTLAYLAYRGRAFSSTLSGD